MNKSAGRSAYSLPSAHILYRQCILPKNCVNLHLLVCFVLNNLEVGISVGDISVKDECRCLLSQQNTAILRSFEVTSISRYFSIAQIINYISFRVITVSGAVTSALLHYKSCINGHFFINSRENMQVLHLALCKTEMLREETHFRPLPMVKAKSSAMNRQTRHC